MMTRFLFQNSERINRQHLKYRIDKLDIMFSWTITSIFNEQFQTFAEIMELYEKN